MDRHSQEYRRACLDAGLELVAGLADPGRSARHGVWIGEAYRGLRLVAWGRGEVEAIALGAAQVLRQPASEARRSARRASSGDAPPPLPNAAFRALVEGRNCPRESRCAPASEPARIEAPNRPPWPELSGLLRSCGPPADDPEVARWLRSRSIPPDLLGASAPAFAIPEAVALPAWAGSKAGTWREAGFRLLLPLYDFNGFLRSVIARRVRGGGGAKALPPVGFEKKHLVLANGTAAAVLRSGLGSDPVLVVEGEPDFLTFAAALPGLPVFGVSQGAWAPEFANRLQSAAAWWIATDDDAPGDRYARDIRRTLPAAAAVQRLCTPRLYRSVGHTRSGKLDWNDAACDGLFDIASPDSALDALGATAQPFPNLEEVR